LKHLRIFLTAVALMSLSFVTWAEDADLQELLRNPVTANYKAYAEFKMANYAAARVIWEALAQRGNVEANFNLGILHEDGLGVPQNIQMAIAHYEKAATVGSSKAQYRLGLLYSVSAKLPKNDVKADKWFAAAAAQGDKDAMAYLAQRAGTGKNQRYQDFLQAEKLQASGLSSEAAAIFKQLAQEGDTRSRSRLAWMYEAGQGMPRDLNEAAKLFRQSAEEGDAEAQYAIAVMLETGKGQTQDAREAQVWLSRAAAQGHEAAKAALKK